MSFSHKKLAFTFIMGEGDFGEGGADTIKLSDLRASVNIVENGGAYMSNLNLSLYGMTMSHMNKLSTLGIRATVLRRNSIVVEAGDTDKGMSVIFQGTIVDAWADFSGMPNVVFQVQAFSAFIPAMKPVPPTSFNGLVDVATVMSGLAKQSNLAFTNDGVGTKIENVYFPGTAHEQIDRCAQQAGIEWVITNQTLAIWPRGGARGKLVPVVSPRTGLIGYPTFTQSGIQFATNFNPSLTYGTLVEVQSDIKPACGQWCIATLAHHLEAEIPGGQWQSLVKANAPGFFVKH